MNTRIIKFRAWDEKRKLMVRDFSLTTDGAALTPYTGLGYEGLHETTLNLMQFTGLLDKNGVEIYEGDVVRDEEGDHWLIRWKVETAQFLADLIGAEGTIYEELVLDDIGAVVIGNIYENKDLPV